MTAPLASVLVPYRSDAEHGGHRDAAWAWNAERWARLLPECEVIVSSDDSGGDTPAAFNHPAAINACAARATSDVFIVADADTAFDPMWVLLAVHRVRTRVAPWVLPMIYAKLTEAATATVLAGDVTGSLAEMDDPTHLEWRGVGCANSGLVVIPREGFERVGGYDERISYYGADDVIARICLDSLWGPVMRSDGAVFHMWHPQPPEHAHGHVENERQQALVAAYTEAANSDDPAAAVRAVRFG